MEKIISCNITDENLIDLGIDYKQLNKADFEGIDTSKDILSIEDGEYLSSAAWDYIDLDAHNTVVINSSVGIGKSYLAREIAKKYYMANDEMGVPQYCVIFAAPYKSLVEQYVKDITEDLRNEGFEDVDIPDYNNLLENDFGAYNANKTINNIKNISSKRMHVITVNCLLGNPGENTVEQNFVKRNYLEQIIEISKDEQRKIVIIFDELHDAVHNFKQKLIFSLWRFRTSYTLHKAFILSATFNEASKIVIKYIAELTSKKLQIIETDRIQRTSSLSNLHIHLNRTNNNFYDFDSEEIIEVLNRIITKHDTINILSYSRTLCSDIIRGEYGLEIRKLLLSKYGNRLNICIPEKYHPSRRQRIKKGIPNEVTYSENFEEGKCNIGTIFKTGINIEEENSGYVIILPSKKAIQNSITEQSLGIFTKGIIPLIQSLARVRKKSDIYVLMSYPNSDEYIDMHHGGWLGEDNYMSKLLDIECFKDCFLRNDNFRYLHYDYSKQFDFISKKYHEIKTRLENEIKQAEDFEKEGQRDFLPYLKYPTLDMFILEDGEKYLYNKYAIWGKNLSSYMIWAAFNNQFVNCKLTEVSSSAIKEQIKIDNVQGLIYDVFTTNYNQYFNEIKVCDLELYNNLFRIITSTMDIQVKKEGKEEYVRLQNYMLARHIMAFIQRFIKGNRSMNKKYMKLNETGSTFETEKFSEDDYLLCCIANSLKYDSNNDRLTKDAKDNDLVDAYRDLSEVREQFVNNELLVLQDQYGLYVKNKLEDYQRVPFDEESIQFIVDTMKKIKKDSYYSNFRIFQNTNFDNYNEAIKDVFKELKCAFFNISYTKKVTVNNSDNNSREQRYYIQIKELPINRTGINLLYYWTPYNKEENYENREDYLYSVKYGYHIEPAEIPEDAPLTESELLMMENLENKLSEINIQNREDSSINEEERYENREEYLRVINHEHYIEPAEISEDAPLTESELLTIKNLENIISKINIQNREDSSSNEISI